MNLNSKQTNSDELVETAKKLLREYGGKGLEMAKQQILSEKTESEAVNESIKYFMLECWRDFSRPGLLSIVCESIDDAPDLTTPVVVALSLLSGGIDIHDDIVDQSMRKGGRLTVLGKFGQEIALLIGDALIFKGLTLLSQDYEGISREKMNQINTIVKDTFFELGTAEALELCFRGKLDVKPQEYLSVIEKKAADVEAHTRIGGILGNATKQQQNALGRYGRLLGMLLILRDDFIDVLEPEEAKHRIQTEHLPLPLLYTLQNPKAKSKLTHLLAKKHVTNKEAQQISEIVDDFGGFKKTTELMEGFAAEAEKALSHISSREKLTLILNATIPHY